MSQRLAATAAEARARASTEETAAQQEGPQGGLQQQAAAAKAAALRAEAAVADAQRWIIQVRFPGSVPAVPH